MTFDIRSIIADSIELLCYEIIQDICYQRKNVNYLSNQLEFLLGKIDFDEFHGSIACRLDLTILILKVCEEPAHDKIVIRRRGSRTLRISETLTPSTYRTLSEFSPENWEDLIADLKSLDVSLRRKDARRIIIPETIKEFPVLQENVSGKMLASDISESSIEANDTSCPVNLNDIIDNLHVQQGLSIIRQILSQDLTTTISFEVSNLYRDFINNFVDDKDKYNDLASLFEDTETCSLKSRDEIKSIMSSNNLFSLEAFQQKFREFIQKWHDQNLPVPVLVQLDYKKVIAKCHSFNNFNYVTNETLSFSSKVSREDDVKDVDSRKKGKDSSSDATSRSQHCSEGGSVVLQDAVSSLKNSTSHLSTAIGVDPLREIMEEINDDKGNVKDAGDKENIINAYSKRSNQVENNTPEIYKKKRSAVAMDFSDSDEDSVRGADQIYEENPVTKKVVKRRKFSEEEKDAIKEGVKKYGLGKWSKIKSESNGVLQNRTNVNIKDCCRTMMRNGEI